MKQLKPRDKVTQHMTRDGLTLDNQTTGESINISSREAEQDYSAAEPGGTAEKVLERAGDIRERSKAKRAAKDGANTAAQATGPASRLQFTAEERADPALSKYVHKAEKRADKLDAAKEALPKKRVVTKETVYDEAKGKAKTKLHFDKVEKPAPKLKPNPASRPMEEAGLYLHGKIHEVEYENVGVEGGHKGEELAERQAGKAIRSGIRRHKLKPYRAAAKAEKKAIAANAEYIYQKSLRDNPEMAQAVKNPVARFWQKQKIKRDYAKAARAAGQTAQGAASATKTTAAAAKKAAEKSKQAASFVARHWKGVLLIGGVGLMLMLIMGGLQSCTAMFGSAGTGVAATSYLSEDSDMLGAEAAYADMEADLQYELDNYESLHPGYDEYRFDLDEIGHDPYVLTSILSALHEGVYTLGDVQGDLAMLFEKQYTLTQTIETETRYRTETRTDSEGNTYTVQVPYTYYICNVKLENFDMSHLPVYIMGEEQMSLYAVYMHTLGNRPDLFPNGTYPNASTVKEPTYYDIPPEALEDATFAAMMAEAEKYVGYAKLHAIDPDAPVTEQADPPDSRTREVQAESVAYAVCQHYGLDTSDYSFGYVAGWSSGKDLKELRASLETIRATAHELITTIDGHLAELQQQRQAQQAVEQIVEPTVEQAAEQPAPDSVFSKLPPEQQQEMTDSVKTMLQTLIDADVKSTGEVTQGTLDAIQTQGFVLSSDRTLQRAEAQEAAYRLESGNILFIQTSENGFDYTVYGPDYKEIDGGQLDNTEYSLSEARDEIFSGIAPQGHVTETITGDALEDFQEAAEQANAISVQPEPQPWNGIDGLLNNKPIMPEATPTERANALIDWAERDGQRMGNEERRLIVEYAETVGDTDKVIELINRLCEQGYEMQHGHMDDFVRSQIESEIAVAKAEQQTALDPAAEPVVTILFTESPHLEMGQQMPLHEADALFARLDAEHRGGGYYDKTDFRIDFTFQGEPHSYSGRQDFGDRDGSLIEHIREYQTFYLNDEKWKDHDHNEKTEKRAMNKNSG